MGRQRRRADPIRHRITSAVDDFRSVQTFVRLPADIVDILRATITPGAEQQISSGSRSLDDVTSGTRDFLQKIVELRSSPSDAWPPGTHPLYKFDAAPLIGRSDVRAAQEKFWCTIFPFCSLKD